MAESRIGGGRPTLVFVAVIGLMATAASIVVAFVPPREEDHPAMAVFKVVCRTGAFRLAGAAFYRFGKLRVRSKSVAVRSHAIG